MAAITRTTNFRLPIPPAGKTPWQAYYSELANVLDSVLGRFIAIGGFLGAWENSTGYSVGNKLVDTDNGVVYQCFSAHTSAASPTTFAQDRTARPSLWITWSSTGIGAGAWAAGTAYGVGDFVSEGSQWAVCIVAHTAGATFAADLALGYWSVLVDLSAYGAVTFPITVAQGGTNSTTAATARTALGLAIGTDVQAFNGNLASLAGLADISTLLNLAGISLANLNTIAGYASLTNLTALVGLTGAANKLPYFTSASAMDVTDLTATGRSIIDDASTSAVRTTLGLGTAAVLDVGTTASKVVQLDGSAKLPAVDGSQLTGLAVGDTIPVGTISAYAGSSAPTGWLLCYGQAISRTTYADLFAITSTLYGAGDTVTTFNIPDLRGRFPLGDDDMGGAAANRVASATTLGATSGEQYLQNHAHLVSGSTSTNTGGAAVDSGAQDVASLGGHTHTMSFNSGNPTSATISQMNPFQIISYIIKT